MNLAQYLSALKNSPGFMDNVMCWRELPGREAKYTDFPPTLNEKLVDVLKKRGIHQLYSHQRHAIDAIERGEDVVVVTPTASGKTLCYNLPVLNQILKNEDARALYLFPTKALSSDQVAELYGVIEALGAEIKAYTYDGDTPAPARTLIRQAGHVVVTNPDMLHAGILPHHTKWVKLFENLKYVVIDEIHAYRGIFGSNLANVIKRLKRICAFYGAHPQFICCSATIKNPQELASIMTGRQVLLVDDNGAPTGTKHVILYNPPVINRQLGIRQSALSETEHIAAGFLRNKIQTIVFARSRLHVEVMVRQLKDMVRDPLGEAGTVRGYRGGYLPTLRRQIERELRAGNILTVVSTNALELGIDIGQLEACILCGYPGTIASTWQQAGRAGRRNTDSLLLMVASSSPLDQFIVNNPEYFFGQSPEMALINPDNLYIQLNHFKCAAYELPFVKGEDSFGDPASTAEMLEYLAEERIVREVGDRYYWMAEEFPQAGISLRSAADQNYLIIDISTPGKHRVIGEMDRFTVPMLLHQYAIYMHEGKQFQVEELDFDDKKAYVRAVDVDYYTDADLTVSLKVLDEFDERPLGKMTRHRGEVLVSQIVTLFKKMKLDTHENLGWGPVTLPELEMHTTACWWSMPEGMEQKYGKDMLQGAMVGLAHLIRSIAPVHLMCAPQDLRVTYHVRDPFTQQPTLYLSETTPGGLGLSDRVYEMDMELFTEAAMMLNRCACENGCPGCIGAGAGKDTKRALASILREMSGL